MSLRGKLTEEAKALKLFDEVSEIEKELGRTEILREQLLRKKEMVLQNELEGNVYDGITDDMEKAIKDVIEKIDHYHNRNEFLKETINNATDFWLHPKNMMSLGFRMWPHFSNDMKDEIKFLYPDAYYMMENGSIPRNKLATICNNLKHVKDALSKKEFSVIPKNIAVGDAWSLMHQSYNRFFPLKILVTTLASMINAKKNKGLMNIDGLIMKSFQKPHMILL